MSKTKSLRQVKYLLSKVSPLTEEEKSKLKQELVQGFVRIKRVPKKFS